LVERRTRVASASVVYRSPGRTVPRPLDLVRSIALVSISLTSSLKASAKSPATRTSWALAASLMREATTSCWVPELLDAVDFRVDFFAAFLVDFLAVDFLVPFLAVDFFAVDFFAADFFVDFFAVDFLAAVFFVDFLAAAMGCALLVGSPRLRGFGEDYGPERPR